jgi:hypothetical protein
MAKILTGAAFYYNELQEVSESKRNIQVKLVIKNLMLF